MYKVKFKTDLELDIEMAKQFLRLGTKAGGNFSGAVIKRHPSLHVGSTDKDVEKVITDYYETNLDSINKVVVNFQEQWDKVQEGYFNVVENIFGPLAFRDNYFEAYVSVIDANPRFIEEESFQVSMNWKSCVGTVAHEMLHFAFYRYCEWNLSELIRGQDKNNGLWWHVSEIFNNVVLEDPRFIKVLGGYYEEGYPDHWKYIEEAKRLYKEANQDINLFIISLFKMVEDSELNREQSREKVLD